MFSDQAAVYRDRRPTYPHALFDWLADIVPDRSIAWDCACGSGQATLALAKRFDRVIATDVSAAQASGVPGISGVEVRVEPAENSSIDPSTVSLTLVTQALHWFEPVAFEREVRRVSKPGAMIVALTYDLPRISPSVDTVIDRLYSTLGPWWPAGREHIEDRYATIPFNFPPVEVPCFEMRQSFDVEHLIGFLRSWSSVAAHGRGTGKDIVTEWSAPLRAAWGPSTNERTATWPLTVLAGSVSLPQ